MMRVGVSGRVYDHHVGGNTRYVRELSSRLVSHDVDYLPLRPAFRFSLGPPGLQYAFAETQWAVRPPADLDLDLVHFPADTGPLWSRKAIATAVTVHGVASLHLQAVRTPTQERSWRTRVAAAVRNARRVITVSQSSARDVSEVFGIARDSIAVIPHGIDHDRFTPVTARTDQSLVGAFDLPDEFVLYVGNLDPRKNLVALCAAINSLNEAGRNIPLVVAGKAAWNAAPILDAIHQSSHVHYLGPIPEEALAPLLRRASLFAFPSLYEGFGFPVLEAMACGTPVVTSSRGSLSDVAGEAAIIVDPTDISDIARGINTLWESPTARSDFRERGIENASTYSWDASARIHAEVFRECLV